MKKKCIKIICVILSLLHITFIYNTDVYMPKIPKKNSNILKISSIAGITFAAAAYFGNKFLKERNKKTDEELKIKTEKEAKRKVHQEVADEVEIKKKEKVDKELAEKERIRIATEAEKKRLADIEKQKEIEKEKKTKEEIEKEEYNLEGFYKFLEKEKYFKIKEFLMLHDKLSSDAWILIDHNILTLEKKDAINKKMEDLFNDEEFKTNFFKEMDSIIKKIDADFERIPEGSLYDDTFTSEQIEEIKIVENKFKKDDHKEYKRLYKVISLNINDHKDVILEQSTDPHSSPMSFIKSLNLDYNALPFKNKVIINTGDYCSKPYVFFKEHFLILTETAVFANKLKTVLLPWYSDNFIFICGNHETLDTNYRYTFPDVLKNEEGQITGYGNNLYDFIKSNKLYDFIEKKSENPYKNPEWIHYDFYNQYFKSIDNKALPLFLKVVVKDKEKALYNIYFNHSSMLTEPIYTESPKENGIKGMITKRFYANYKDYNPINNPFYSPCFFNKKLKKEDFIDDEEDLNGFGFYCFSCRIENITQAKNILDNTIGLNSPIKSMQIPYYICGGHDHTGLPWMGECIAQNKITGVSKIKKIDKITNKEIEKKEYILMDNFDKKNPFYIQPPYFKNLFKKYLNRDGMKDFEIVGTKCQHPYHEACKITLAQEFPNFDGYVKYGTEHEKN